MATIKQIKRVARVIDGSLFTVSGNLDYSRLTDAFIRLADMVSDFDGPEESEELWWIETPNESLSEMIVGAYWHFSEWHGGQASDGYAALCALGKIFRPGMTVPEQENLTYQTLAEMAEIESKLIN